MNKPYIVFEGEKAYETKYKGYYATKSGYIISVKVKGGQGSIDTNKPRYHSVKIDKDGYLEVCLSIVENGEHKRIYRRVHRIIWETFNGDIPDGMTIDHDNNIPFDNRLENLQLMTRPNNTIKALKNHPSSKRYRYQIIYKGELLGIYDRKSIKMLLNINEKDWYKHNEKFLELEKCGIVIQKIPSKKHLKGYIMRVEDIENIVLD